MRCTSKPFTPDVGQIIVLFYAGSPLRHNSTHSPQHPTRGVVLKLGRVYAHVQSTGAPVRVRLDGEGMVTMHTVLSAKRLYRKGLIANRAWRTDADIASYVEAL